MNLNAEEFYEKLNKDDDFAKSMMVFQETFLNKLKEIDINEYNSYMRTFNIRTALNKESDRGCVLLAISYLEDVLGRYILAYLNGSKRFKRDFLRTNLSSFNSRINFAYAVGIINEPLMQDLNVLRDIRNKFAHSFEVLDLEGEDVMILMGKLNYKFRDNVSNRRIFITHVYVILSALLPCANKTLDIKSPVDLESLFIHISEQLLSITEDK